MAIELALNDNITFADLNISLNSFSYSAILRTEDVDNDTVSIFIGNTLSTLTIVVGEIYISTSTGKGIFNTNASGISTNAWMSIVVNVSPVDDFSIYINGSIADIDITQNANTDVVNVTRVDITNANASEINARIQDLRLYNRILSATEVATLYNSRCQRVVMNGLVFWAPMDGAAGLSSFDGATLSSANTIIDRISGVQGIPSGSPIGRGNTIQRIY